MARPSRHTARIISILTIPLGVLVGAGVIWRSTYSAFTATVSNTGNSFAVGSVALSDDANGVAAFTATNLKPGDGGTRCVAVTSNGTLASTVTLYGANYSSTDNVGANVLLTITQGTGGSFGDCSGFTPLDSGDAVYSGTLADFATTDTDFATGSGTWAPTGPGAETRTFRFVYTLSAFAPDTVQGGTAAVDFTWEAQNN